MSSVLVQNYFCNFQGPYMPLPNQNNGCCLRKQLSLTLIWVYCSAATSNNGGNYSRAEEEVRRRSIKSTESGGCIGLKDKKPPKISIQETTVRVPT